MNTLKAQPAEAHARIEKVKLTRLKDSVLVYTKTPNAVFTKKANNKNMFGTTNLDPIGSKIY